jgi:tight adherence protein B
MIPVAFFGILIIMFGVMVLVTNPSQGQKAVERRIAGIRSSSGIATDSGASSLSPLLKASSGGGWLGNFLDRFQISRAIEMKIIQADSKTSVVKLLVSSAGLAFTGLVVSYLFIPILPVQLAAAAGAAYVPYGLLSFKRSRRINAFNEALPDAIDMMGRALRAGHSMVASINIIAEQGAKPVSTEFSEVFKQQNFGLPLRDALFQMLDHVPSQDLRVLVTGILVQKETGGNLAEILDRTVFVIRERLRIHGEIKTHTAQGRMTGWILCMLPVVMLVIINITNPGYSKVLMETPLGHKLIYVGLGLITAGSLIIRQIINGIEV